VSRAGGVTDYANLASPFVAYVANLKLRRLAGGDKESYQYLVCRNERCTRIGRKLEIGCGENL